IRHSQLLLKLARTSPVNGLGRRHRPMPLSFANIAKGAESVGQTPRSARVPLDPLFARGIKCLPPTKSRPGGRLQTRASAPQFTWIEPASGAVVRVTAGLMESMEDMGLKSLTADV